MCCNTKTKKEYKYGEPDDYGDFPYVSESGHTDEEFKKLLFERLPEYYNMEIVCSVEEQVLNDVSSQGIDAHLEAMGPTKDEIVDRKIGNRVVCRAHALDFDKEGMICLIRRLKEYEARQYDHSDCDFGHTEYDWDSCTEEKYRDHEYHDFWSAAHQLRSCILETLKIETM